MTVFASSALKRQLSLREPLRLGRITYSARTLWLLRPLVTENSAAQIGKKLATGYEDQLAPGMGDRRPLLRTIGAAKTVQIDTLRGTRDVLPVGAWAGDVKPGAMSTATATDILNHPDLWPVEIVGRAIRHMAREMIRMPAIASLAQSDRWFHLAVSRSAG